MNKKVLKVIACLTAGVLIVVLGVIANAFLGNPVSYLLAKKCAEQNLAEHYADQGYVLQSLNYNFKDTCYTAFAAVPGSQDQHFELRFSMTGKLKNDSYSYDVLSGKNTFLRLDKEYRERTKAVFDSNETSFHPSKVFGTLKNSDIPEWWQNGVLKPDEEYDLQELGAQYGIITIGVGEQDVTVERAAEILLKTKEAMIQQGVAFHAVSLNLHQPWKEDGVSPEEIEGMKWGDLKVLDIQLFPSDEIYEEGLTDRIRAVAELQNIT